MLKCRILHIAMALPLVICASIFLYFMQQEDGAKTAGDEKVALVLPGKTTDHGWNRALFIASSNAERDLGVKFVYLQDVSADDLQKAVSAMRDRRITKVILGTFKDPALLLSQQQGIKEGMRYAGFYTPKEQTYGYTELKLALENAYYLAGFAAAKASKSGRIGFVVENFEALSKAVVNAFVMGARQAVSGIMVFVTHSDYMGHKGSTEAACDRLLDIWTVDTLAYFASNNAISRRARMRGVHYVGFLEDPNTASNLMVTQIKISAENILRQTVKSLSGQYVSELYFPFGDQDVSMGTYGGDLDEAELKELRALDRQMRSGYVIFKGDIFDSDGNERCHRGQTLSRNAFLGDPWFVEGTYLVP